MKKMVLKIVGCLVCLSALAAEEDVSKLSEAMGHLIGKNLQALGLEVDLEALVRGLENEASGKKSPLGEEECVEAIAAYQQEQLGKIAAENGAKADAFLAENRKKESVHVLQEGKLQYEIIKEGSGEAVQSYNAPLVRMKGHFQSGGQIGEVEETLALDSTILGISQGLVGMKEGEKRILYIHPDLGFTDRTTPEMSSLLIFEVEVLKADVTAEAHSAGEREGPDVIVQPDELESPARL